MDTENYIQGIDAYNIEDILNNKKQNKMNIENLDFLKSLVKNKGFGENLGPDLEKKITEGPQSFSLETSIEHGAKTVDYKLNFKKGKEGDMYFFNNYDATLKQPLQDGTVAEKKQAFYLDKGRGFTAKEAFNLLEGRGVYQDLTTKESVPYKAWVKLDLDNPLPNGQHKTQLFGDDHGKKKFSLDTELSKFTIREMDNPQHKGWLVDGLERGNLQKVNMVRGEKKVNDANDPTNKERVTFVEADPQFKSVKVYDENLKKLFVAQGNPVKLENAAENKPVQNQAKPVQNAEKQKAGVKTEFVNLGKKQGVKM
jgi:hypothetical protein